MKNRTTLPASLLAAAEAHACFSGRYRHESPVQVCTGAKMATSIHVCCEDCLAFRVGSLVRELPEGMTEYKLAEALSAHVIARRGYRWAVSGYHSAGCGFWLSAAYYGNGLFIVDASRNRALEGAVDASGARLPASAVDFLVHAFKHQLVAPESPLMLDPVLYAEQVVYLRAPLDVPSSKADILASPQCSEVHMVGYRRVSIIEFLPLTQSQRVEDWCASREPANVAEAQL